MTIPIKPAFAFASLWALMLSGGMVAFSAETACGQKTRGDHEILDTTRWKQDVQKNVNRDEWGGVGREINRTSGPKRVIKQMDPWNPDDVGHGPVLLRQER
jgi:hypothetical protein